MTQKIVASSLLVFAIFWAAMGSAAEEIERMNLSEGREVPADWTEVRSVIDCPEGAALWQLLSTYYFSCIFPDGTYHGPYVTFHEFQKNTNGEEVGIVRLRGMYDHGRRDGTWTEYWRSGAKDREWSYRNAAEEGTYTSWHANGVVTVVGQYVAGLRIGEWIYHDSEGAKIWQFNFRDGRIAEIIDLAGKKPVSYACTEPAQFRERVFRSYDVSCETEDGKKEGWSISLLSGRLFTVGQYKNDLEEGEWKYFSTYGHLERTIVYEKGVEVSRKERPWWKFW